ncbi:HSPB1-associated protein 1, partial [Chrysoperla carnea]|uniref:HSPB1-associated protein 1 n=1 Tax=Chrysoperla carnea TaxID=189513 RepID=UPI001D06ED20
MNKKPEAYELKNVIDNAKEPLVFKNIINFFNNWTMNLWRSEFKDLQLPFRKGYNSICKCGKNHPQWERFTETVYLTFDEFLKLSDNICNYWYYFDYKRMVEWFSTSSNIMKNISWSDFGYADVTGLESTIWIGSKGAHTPCHIDTYENNLVLQVFGEKKWILFPPNTDLKPTRIPYEESSIYSKINFFHPDMNDLIGLKGGREVLLKPGDVLFVPQGWWHYVENVSNVAISINVWIPTTQEKETHLHESIVQLLVAQLTKSLPDTCNKLLINPNNEDIFLQPLTILYEQIKYCLNNSCKQQNIATATVVVNKSNNESKSNNSIIEL